MCKSNYFQVLIASYCFSTDEKTRSKFLLYAGNDYQEEGGLVDYIDTSLVPDFLGGPCVVKISSRSVSHVLSLTRILIFCLDL